MSAPSGGPPAVMAEHVTKRFVVPHERRDTLKERVLHPVRRAGVHRFEALNDVTFRVERGEFFGIVGRNGSGKSSLLKCLAGIYRTDAGQIYVDGRMSTFIELGVGFNPELAALDNVVMNGVMLGLSPREARERFDEVVRFAELEEFVDLKLKNYSSGMHVRLAFSVMVQIGADIMLVDEILAVGDASFQQKCFDVFFRMRDEGKTVLFVTHDMAAVQRFCNRAMLLERGEVVAIGAPDEVADRYLTLNFESIGEVSGNGLASTRAGDGAARVTDAWLEGEEGARQGAVAQGRRCALRALIEIEQPITDPAVAVAVVNAQHQNIFVASSAARGERSGQFEAGDTFDFSVSFENVLAPGRYAVSTLVTHPGGQIADRWESIFTFVVSGAGAGGGLVDLSHDVRIETRSRVPEGELRT